MGIACSMSNILQQPCGGTVVTPPPPPPPPCQNLHPDFRPDHLRTWISDTFPSTWTGPFTIDWGDGTVESSADGAEAHEYLSDGTFIVVLSDSSSPAKTCSVSVAVPHS